MAKVATRERPTFRCADCGWLTAKWVGRCGECQAWGTVADTTAPAVRTTRAGPVSSAARPIGEVDVEAARAVPTGVDELDRVLGGGMVPGAVVLMAGEPGVGKSTLLLDVAARFAERARALYVTGEESTAQVRLRADRIGALRDELFLAAETDLAAVLGHVDAVKPDLLVVDSVQTIASAEVDGSPGNVSQVREVAAALIRVAKERGIATVLVGHVTKDGSIAGPRLLEHLVDVVLHFEGDRNSRLRLVRGVKNRYGPADEVGCFDLSDDGIVGLADPSGLFLSQQREAVPGTCVTVTVEGKRPLVAEVQSLVVPSLLNSPRRTTSGLDGGRLAMVLAVLQRRAQVQVGACDVYASTVGGVRLTEPATDLAVALAVAGSAKNDALATGLVAIGEVGLAGEIRRVTGTARRLSEAARLGFTHALVPPDPGKVPSGIEAIEVRDLPHALRVAFPGAEVIRFASRRH
ncbi:MAG TPA: DNA repair protein RadA [Mycobacteriales bacterium]|nr:DNA repair protein RadA [Mycobacteriales bacterium]